MNPVNKYEIDLCHGPLFSRMVKFSIPLMLSNTLHLLFNAADLIVVGRFAGAGAMAAVGASTHINILLLNIFFGLALGVNVLTARFTGARDSANVSTTLHTAVVVAATSGIGIMLLSITLARPILELLKTPAEILPQAVLYLRVYALGIPFILVYNFCSSVLRASGDTRRPLIFMTTSGVLNVLLNLLFVIVFHWGVAGVAAATALSFVAATAMILVTLVRSRSAYRLEWRKLRPDFRRVWEIVKIGVPAGIQGSFYSISTLAVQSSVNSFGWQAVAGNTAGANLEAIVHVNCSSFYGTAVTFAGQHCGAKKYKRLVRSIVLCCTCAAVCGGICGVVFYLFGTPLLGIYNKDPEVIRWGLMRMKILLVPYFLCSLMDSISGTLRGLGHSFKPMLVTFLGVCVGRIAWIWWVFPHFRTMENLMLSYPLSWLFVCVVNGTMLAFVCRSLFRSAAHQRNFATLKRA